MDKKIENNVEMDLSTKFRLIRTRERFTQKDMADLVGISYASYQNYERGKRRAINVLEVMKIFNHERFSKYLVWFMTGNTTIVTQESPE